MFPSISQSAATALGGFHAPPPLPGLSAAAIAPSMTQSMTSLSTSVPGVYNAGTAPSAAAGLRTTVVSATTLYVLAVLCYILH